MAALALQCLGLSWQSSFVHDALTLSRFALHGIGTDAFCAGTNNANQVLVPVLFSM